MLGDLGKLIVAKGFKKLPKVQKIARSGHTDFDTLLDKLCICTHSKSFHAVWPEMAKFHYFGQILKDFGNF